MEYYLLTQDKRYAFTPQLLNLFDILDRRDINRLDAHRIGEQLAVTMEQREEYDMLDILDGGLYLVSGTVRQVLSFYDDEIIFKDVILISEGRNVQMLYHLPIFEDVACLHPDCEYSVGGSVIKKFVIDRGKVFGKSVFRIDSEASQHIAVRLDVAESLLRRGLRGLALTEVEVK